MAGVMTHLVIANEILKLLPEGIIKDRGLFYLGSFAPDAVHAREGYIRAYKKHTHFRDDIPDRTFEQKDNFELYQSRLADFINANKNGADGLLDLYRGYVVHILTDELFIRSLRKEFVARMEQLGIDQGDKLFFEYIVTDMSRNDMLLMRDYKEMDIIRKGLEQVQVFPVDGYISEQEMRISLEWLLEQHFYKKLEFLEPVYMTTERMQQFIHTSSTEVVKILSEGKELPRML